MLIKEYVEENQKFVSVKDGDFEVVLCDLGASIFAIKLNERYMTQTPVDVKDFVIKRAFAGKTVGRVGNRIKGNVITIEEKKYKLIDNEKGNTLHGGVEGLSTKSFDYEIKEEKGQTQVIYSYLSKDGESGFPGNLSLKVIYTIIEDNNELRIDFVATTDQVTACSLTNHAYYTVGERSLKDTKLLINASHYLYCNPIDLIPIEKREVTDYLDFRKVKSVMHDINNPILRNSKANGYDHHYYFDDNNPDSLKAELIGKEYKMQVYTNFGGMQIYSSNHETVKPQHELELGRNISMAIEPQDEFLHLHLLRPNEIYSRFMRFIFIKL